MHSTSFQTCRVKPVMMVCYWRRNNRTRIQKQTSTYGRLAFDKKTHLSKLNERLSWWNHWIKTQRKKGHLDVLCRITRESKLYVGYTPNRGRQHRNFKEVASWRRQGFFFLFKDRSQNSSIVGDWYLASLKLRTSIPRKAPPRG